MEKPAASLLALLALLAACESKLDRLKRFCESQARVEVRDATGWQEYLRDLKNKDDSLPRSSWETPEYLGDYIRLGLIEGYDLEWQPSSERFDGKMPPLGTYERTPDGIYEDDFQVKNNGRLLAIVHDVTAIENGTFSWGSASCTTAHPELYGVKRAHRPAGSPGVDDR